MQQMRSDLARFLAATVLAATLSAPAVAQQCDRLWASGHELWIDDGAQARLVVSDVQGMLDPRWSPSGDRIAYAHAFRFDDSQRSEVVIVDNDGRKLGALPIPAESDVNAILQIGWRDGQHVFIEGHVNPSTSMYLEWSLATGRLVGEKAGSSFAVSPDGRFVAQRANVPHGTRPPYDSDVLMINDKVIYPSGDAGYHRFAAGLSWSADSRQLALLDRAGETTDVVVIASDGNHLRRTQLGDVGVPLELSWSGTNTLLIEGDAESWRVDLSTGRVDKIAQFPKASQSVVPSRSLSERLHGATLRAADVRCAQ